MQNPAACDNAAQYSDKLTVQVISSRRQVHVWYCENGQPVALAGTIADEVASDASRYGQDLVGELVDQALRIADRRRMEVRPRQP
jgi:hypothetical protein